MQRYLHLLKHPVVKFCYILPRLLAALQALTQAPRSNPNHRSQTQKPSTESCTAAAYWANPPTHTQLP